MDGYQKLKNFQSVYGGLDGGVLPHLNRWLVDYVIYYGLDPALLADTAQVSFDKALAVLVHIGRHDSREIMEAVNRLVPALTRSRFYREYPEDMDAVVPGYSAKCLHTTTAGAKERWWSSILALTANSP